MSEYLKLRLSKAYVFAVTSYCKEHHRAIGAADLMESNTFHQITTICRYYLPMIVTTIKIIVRVAMLLLLAAIAIVATPHIVHWAIEVLKVVIATLGTMIGLLL